MYHMLIVDDEIHTVRGIESGVNWNNLNVSIVHVAYNIRMAMEVFANHPIDIMICDIEMPQGNGLELLKWVREVYPATETIFLTCHADFDYAKQAIQLGSLEYLLKPVPYAELETVIRKAIDKIIKERERIQYSETYKYYYNLWETHKPMLIERFWLDLLNQIIPSRSDHIKAYLVNQNIPYTESMRFLPILISVQRWHKELTLRDEKIMEYALRNAAEEMTIKKEKQGQVVQIRKGILLAIIPVADPLVWNKEQMRKDGQAYIHSCNEYFYCDLSCYVGEPVFIHEMLAMFQSLLDLETNNVSCNNRVFLLNERTKHHEPIKLPDMSVWSEMLKSGSKEKLILEIREFLQSWTLVEGLDARILHEFFQNFLQMVYHILQQKGLQAHQIFSDSVFTERASSAIRSVIDLLNWVQYTVDKAVEHIHEAEETQTVIDKVKSYIAQHLDHELLSREEISNHVFLNPDYLTRMFKKETGISLSNYLLQERINFAKVLLVTTDKPVSGIASSLGYSNFSHFSKIFKKATNLNPQEFRKMLQR